jgi:2-polyprenyl-3-methyl-5-hydroxy-6-metoxy-1,4-benzoquinol methylase
VHPETRELLERLNGLWHVAGAPPPGGALSGTLLYRVRLMVARVLAPQETFNAAVVEYINTTANALEQARIATDEAIRYRESLAARERRIETASAAIIEAHEEIRTSIGQLQQATHALKREVARLASEGAGPFHADQARLDSPSAPSTASATTMYENALDGHQYVGFEDQFRGSPEEIRERLEAYVPLFAGASNVLDVGCGRGEFLMLLRERGVTARGVDVNPAMVETSRERGLEASATDALAYLSSLPDESLGGLFSAQVIEHLEPAYLLRLLEMAFAKLRSGAPIVLETINPACWFAFFSSYLRDITHAQPVHPETLKYLLVASGFQRVDIRYRSPYPEQHKLQPVAATPALAEWAATLNENADKLNRLLFTHLDYAAAGYRP